MKTTNFTLNDRQWNLPEGAKARFGKYAINDFQFSNVISGENVFIDPVFSPDGCTLSVCQVSLTQRGTETDILIHFWDFVKDSRFKTLRRQGMTSSLVFSPDGSMFALACVDGIELYNNTIKAKVKTFTEFKGSVYTLTFSPDGRTLAAGCSETLGGGSTISTIYLWDVATGNQLKTFTGLNRGSDSYIGHTGKISSMCFSPDGCTLASGCCDGVVLLWDVVPEINKTTITAEETQFDVDEINAIAQQAAYEDEQYIVENEPPIEASNTLELSADEQGLYDILFSGTGTRIGIDSQVNVNESKHIYVQRPYQIQQFCEERGIKTLIHFTRIENLFTILQKGLIGRSRLEASEEPFLWNDSYRADGHPDANCLSISFPNYQMFYGIREQKKSEGVNDSQWIVLLLDAKLLWELDCAFCQRNAASNAVSTIPLDERKKPTALMVMFGDFYSIKRQDLQIPKNYPTHPQAEVLVFDQIPAEYIDAIHFRDATILEEWRSNYTGTLSDKFFVNRKYFDARSDYGVWKSENFDSEGLPLPDTNRDSDLELSKIDDDIPF